MILLTLALSLVLPAAAQTPFPNQVHCSLTRRGPNFILEKQPDGSYRTSISAVGPNLKPSLSYQKDGFACSFHPDDGRVFHCVGAGGTLRSSFAHAKDMLDGRPSTSANIWVRYEVPDFPLVDGHPSGHFGFDPDACRVVTSRAPAPSGN